MAMALATLSTITSNVITPDPRLDPKPEQKQKQATLGQNVKEKAKHKEDAAKASNNGEWQHGDKDGRKETSSNY